MTIITQDDCPRCEAEKLIYPYARCVRSEELLDKENIYQGEDRNELMSALMCSDGEMPIVLP